MSNFSLKRWIAHTVLFHLIINCGATNKAGSFDILGNEFFGHFTNSSEILESFGDVTQDEAVQCLTDLALIQDGINKNMIWAIKFADAWGKLPSGILYGHLMELGNFDECVNLHPVLSNNHQLNGKYCLANVPFSKLTTNPVYKDVLKLSIGLCLPASCPANIIDLLIKQILNVTLADGTTLVEESSCVVREGTTFKALDWVAIGVLLVLAIVIILSSIYDYTLTNLYKNVKPHPLYLAFSVRTNLRQLFRITSHVNQPHVIPCLNGIRCMSIIWIIFGHCYMMHLLSPTINAVDVLDWMHSPFSMFMQMGTISVDTFFFLSGLLLALVALRGMDKTKGKINVPLMYLHRYLRLTPVLALTVLLFMTLYRYMGSGPLWNNYTGAAELCQETWWATLLYVQNYAAAGKMCLGHSWYLAVDTQLYLISPLALILIWHWQKKGAAVLALIGLLMAAYLFSIIVIDKLLIFNISRNLGADATEMQKIYYSTHTRLSPWIIGILFGYFLHSRNGRRSDLSNITICLGWLLSLTLLFTVIFALYPNTQPGASSPNPLESAFYLTLSRIAWPLALCWIVFACVNGYGGPANQFLSWSLWQPLSKLSYVMYLWHLLVVMMNAGRTKTNTYFSDYDVILRFWGDFGITLMVSLVVYLTIEAPMAGVEKFLFPQKSKPASQAAQTNAAASVSTQNLCD